MKVVAWKPWDTPEGPVLRPTDRQPAVIKKQAIWVRTGKLPPGFDIVQAIPDDHEHSPRGAALESTKQLRDGEVAQIETIVREAFEGFD